MRVAKRSTITVGESAEVGRNFTINPAEDNYTTKNNVEIATADNDDHTNHQ